MSPPPSPRNTRPVALSTAKPVRLGLLPLLVAGGLLGGCATPPGRLFPPRNPALVWPGPPEIARIRWLGMLRGTEDLHAGKTGGEAFLELVRGPRPQNRFIGPSAVALSADSRLAVSDGPARAVHILDLERRTHTVTTAWPAGAFGLPLGLAWVADRLYVADAQRHEIIELNSAGEFQRTFGTDVLLRPVGLAYVPAREQLFVADGGAHSIVCFDRAGRAVTSFGERGADDGQFNFPSYICVRGDRLLVADSGNFRVQILDLDGRCLGVLGQKGDAAGDLSLPKGVALDSAGHIYIVDAHFENVQIFDDAGQLLLAFGQEGRNPGEFALPAGMTIDASDRIWIADSANCRVQVFEFLKAGP